MHPKVKEISLLAKKRYCELRKPGWLNIIYKVQSRQRLTDLERRNYEQLEREMLNTVNKKADLISGLTRNNKKSARFAYLGCVFVVKYNRGVGKIITVLRE